MGGGRKGRWVLFKVFSIYPPPPTPSPNPFTFPEKKANMKKWKRGRGKKDTKTNG